MNTSSSIWVHLFPDLETLANNLYLILNPFTPEINKSSLIVGPVQNVYPNAADHFKINPLHIASGNFRH